MAKIIMVLALLAIAFLLVFRFYVVPKTVNNNRHFFDVTHDALPNSPNYFLSCPKSQCPTTERKMESPIFAMDVGALKSQWNRMLAGQQPRLELLLEDNDQQKMLYVTYSRFWHFPDLVQIQFISEGEASSSVFLASKSLFGHYDFNVNKDRVQALIAQLLK